jgi:5-methylcytosine-specific restriction endonuclease McrA
MTEKVHHELMALAGTWNHKRDRRLYSVRTLRFGETDKELPSVKIEKMAKQEYQRQYYIEHRELILARNRAWQKAHRESERQRVRRYRSANREKINANRRQFTLEHPEVSRGYGKAYYHKHKEAERERNRSWQRANRRKIAAINKRSYQKHKEKRKAEAVAYREKNKEKCKACIARWIEKHREQYNFRKRKRRVRKAQAVGMHTFAQWMSKVSFYGWKCWYCGIGLTMKSLTKDHAIPLTRGGTDYVANLLPSCRKCNSHKHTRTVFEVLRANA